MYTRCIYTHRPNAGRCCQLGRAQKWSIILTTINLALVAALIGSATLSASSLAKSRHNGASAQQSQRVPNNRDAFDPFHQTGFNGNH
jgi:hypothetical protein